MEDSSQAKLARSVDAARDDVPETVKPKRLLGISPEGQPVDNVNADNRRDITDPNNPSLQISIMSEDLSRVLYHVYIPRTREMPDIVVLDGTPYEVYNTRLNPPQYRECLVSRASWEPITKDTDNDDTSQH